MAATSRMPTSRPKTSTVTRVGISPLCISTRKSVLSSSLSATGSRYWPSMVRCLEPGPACRPARRSSPAATNKHEAERELPSRMAATRNGARQMRSKREQVGRGAQRVQAIARRVDHGNGADQRHRDLRGGPRPWLSRRLCPALSIAASNLAMAALAKDGTASGRLAGPDSLFVQPVFLIDLHHGPGSASKQLRGRVMPLPPDA